MTGITHRYSSGMASLGGAGERYILRARIGIHLPERAQLATLQQRLAKAITSELQHAHIPADLVDGRIGDLGPLEIAAVCHALQCTPYDLWAPATVEQILTVYPPDLWPRETIPLTPTTPIDPGVAVEPAQPTLGPELTR